MELTERENSVQWLIAACLMVKECGEKFRPGMSLKSTLNIRNEYIVKILYSKQEHSPTY